MACRYSRCTSSILTAPFWSLSNSSFSIAFSSRAATNALACEKNLKENSCQNQGILPQIQL